MPSTSPVRASRAAASTAAPASLPAAAASPPGLQSPTATSTSGRAGAPRGPTSTNSPAARSAGSARAAATISGPMPRGSPSVRARRGRALTVGSETNVDEDLAAQRLDVAVERLLLAELLAEARPHVVERVLPLLLLGRHLGDDQLRQGRARIRDVERLRHR